MLSPRLGAHVPTHALLDQFPLIVGEELGTARPELAHPLPSRASGPPSGPVVRPLPADGQHAGVEPSAVFPDRTRRELAVLAFFVLVGAFVGARLFGLP